MMAFNKYLDLTHRMQAEAPELDQPKPEFAFDLGTAPDYETILAGDTLDRCGENQLWDDAVNGGRVLLLGDGGSGKTTIVGRLWRRARELEAFACWVDFRRWSAKVADEWIASDDDSWNAEVLLRNLGLPRVTGQELALARPDLQMVILFDGINEVPSELAEQFLLTADYLARRHPRLGVVVTDRVVRRRSVTPRWQLMRVLAARSGKASSEPLLRNAFFLDLAVGKKLEGRSASDAVHVYLGTHVGLDQDKVLSAAEAAARAYVDCSARVFETKAFEHRVGMETFQKLVEAGQLVPTDRYTHFSNQLVHDTLAADWLVNDDSRWAASWLDALTVKASSFDAVALALGRMDESAKVDKFLRAVYDWNYYAAAFALSRAQEFGDVQVSETTLVALLAMLAERRWDPIVSTAMGVEDALRLVDDDVAHAMLAAKDLGEVLGWVEARPPGDQEFEDWRSLFLEHRGKRTTEALVNSLCEGNSLISWTAANAMRHTEPTDRIIELVGDLAQRDANEMVRWRAVYVLGAWPHSRASEVVGSRLLNDMSNWVRYGAARSLIDIAAKSPPSLRDSTIDWLTLHLDGLETASDQVVGELERALVRRPAPPGWTESISDLVGELFARARDNRQRERWRRLAGRVREAERAGAVGAAVPGDA